jgi:hypothetical protein
MTLRITKATFVKRKNKFQAVYSEHAIMQYLLLSLS